VNIPSEHSLRLMAVLECHSGFKATLVSAEYDERSGQPSTSKRTENVEKIQQTVAEQSMTSQTLLGSVMEFARRS
jgi:hypothetical protein